MHDAKLIDTCADAILHKVIHSVKTHTLFRITEVVLRETPASPQPFTQNPVREWLRHVIRTRPEKNLARPVTLAFQVGITTDWLGLHFYADTADVDRYGAERQTCSYAYEAKAQAGGCPYCGALGRYINLAPVCPEHGPY